LLIGEEGVRVFPNVKPYVVTLGFNHEHPVLRKRDVRLAMNIAIDRRVLVAQVAGGIGVPATDMIWHQHWSRPHEDDVLAFPMDRQRAGQLLDEAGLPRRITAAGAIEPRFRVSCLVLDDPVIQRVAARLQQAYADVGISLDLQPTGVAELGERHRSGRYDAFIAPVVSGYGMSMPYGLFGSHAGPRMITHGYTAAGPASERVRAATSREELREAIHGLHDVLMDDPPAVYLFWQETSRAVGRRVSVPADASSDVLNALARWSIRSRMP
jgi:ABC-type transport system substrate-binding protein